MKRMVLIAIAMFCFVIAVAQETSTVYLISRKAPLYEVFMNVNGGIDFDFTGNSLGLENSPAYQEVTIEGEGKIIVYSKSSFMPRGPLSTGQPKHYACEYQLNVEPGEVYYLYLTYKGLDGMKIEEIDLKKAKKIMSHKKVKVVQPINIKLDE